MMHREIDSSPKFTQAPHGQARWTCVRPKSSATMRRLSCGATPLFLLAALLCGCSATRTYTPPRPPVAVAATTIQPAGEFEAAVLSKLDVIQGEGVIAGAAAEARVEPTYFAANGRRCRRVAFAPGPQDQAAEVRLACSAGGPWFYVPLLTAAPSADTLAQSNPPASLTGDLR